MGNIITKIHLVVILNYILIIKRLNFTKNINFYYLINDFNNFYQMTNQKNHQFLIICLFIFSF